MKTYKQIIILTVFLMLFGEAYGMSLIGSMYRYIFMALTFILLLFYIIICKQIRITIFDRFPLHYAIASLALLVVSFPFWDYYHNIYTYIGIILAFFVYLLDYNTAHKLIIGIVYLSLILTGYEFFTHKLLFINTINDITFDETYLGGKFGVFRAKGLFFGPTILGMFMVTAFLLNNKNIWILISAIICCFFANSRLGIVLLIIPLLILLFKRQNLKYLWIVAIVAIAIISYSQINAEASIDRLLSLSESGNQSSRIYYWSEGIKTFINYPLKNIIFGNNGYYNSIYNNNPESGWICLLTDTGLIGFFFYLWPVLYCIYRFVKQKMWYYTILTTIFIVFNFTITGHLSGTGNLMYMLVVFEFFNKAKYGCGKLDCDTKNTTNI